MPTLRRCKRWNPGKVCSTLGASLEIWSSPADKPPEALIASSSGGTNSQTSPIASGSPPGPRPKPASSHRYGRGSILTTNKGIKDWPELLAGEAVLATAILDRLLHHSHVLNIKGRSYRLRDLEQAISLRQ